MYCDSLHRSVHSSHTFLCFSHTADWLLLLCAHFSLALLLAWGDPDFCIVTTITRWLYLVPFHHLWNLLHLFSFTVTEKCDHPGSGSILTFPYSFNLQVTWFLIPALVYVATVNACSMRDKVPAQLDLVTRKGMYLLDITETCLTTRETFTDLAEMTPPPLRVSPSFRSLEHGGEGGVGLFLPSTHTFSAISLPIQTSFEAISSKLEHAQFYLILLFLLLNIDLAFAPLSLASPGILAL